MINGKRESRLSQTRLKLQQRSSLYKFHIIVVGLSYLAPNLFTIILLKIRVLCL